MSIPATLDSGLILYFKKNPEKEMELKKALKKEITAIKLIRKWSGESFPLTEIKKWVRLKRSNLSTKGVGQQGFI